MLKLWSYNRLILPIAMNGSEIWSLTQLDTKKMNMFENNSLHTILSIKIQDYVSIIEIRKQAEQKKTI